MCQNPDTQHSYADAFPTEAAKLAEVADAPPALLIENVHDFEHAPLDTPVHGMEGIVTAHQMASNGYLGADVLYVPPNESFPLHVHPGDHLLYCLKGTGTVTFGGVVYTIKPGDLYMVDGGIEHAVGAGPEGHWLISIGAPHVPVTNEHRMVVVPENGDYAEAYAAATEAYAHPAHLRP